MRKLLLLLPILLLTACSSLDFQIRTLHTANMYDGIYYNTSTRINSNFVFFQPNNLWWNYSLNYPYNWYGYNSFGTTYNWRYNRWSSNQWFYQPYYNQFIIQPITPQRVIRNRGRVNTPPPIIRTPRLRTRVQQSPRLRKLIPRVEQNIRTRVQQQRTPTRTQVRTPQPIRRVQPPQRTQVREAVRQTQTTRRSSNVVIKNKRNQ